MNFGKSKAKRMSVDAPKITFRDVAGVDEAIQELEEIKEFLENPKKFQALGARIPKGVLLYGPPGTGKTLLARAVAGEAGVPFFSISGSDFVEMFVGVGASRVRDLFEQAKQNSPCIIFMDEIDAVGRHRGAGMGGGHDEREQTLNQLLVEMDGFEMKDNIILIAATNRPDILDPALLRPGRFDRQVVVDRPDRKGRKQILEVHTRGKPLAREIDLDTLAGQTPGFTGADLANLINEAALLTARTGSREISMKELEEGIMRVIAGPEKKTRVMSEKERLVTAYHEVGHAIVGQLLENTDPVHKISIISRGQALGYTISLPTEDKFLTTRAELTDTMAMTLGGRAAEEIVFGEITTGASNDLEKVTETAKQMVMRFGMSERLGPRVFGHDRGQPFLGREFSSEPDYSDEIAREIDDEIRRIVESAHQTAKGLLDERRADLERVSKLLLERETIDAEQFVALLEGKSEEEVFHDVDCGHVTDPAIGETLVSKEDLQRRVAELGQELSRDYEGRDLFMVGVLKGAVLFLADLMRNVSVPCEIDFMAVSSYGSQTDSSGVVRILKDLDAPIEGRHVLIVEDIIDSGLTLQYLMRNLRARNPASLEVCALLTKPERLRVDLSPRYVGFEIPNRFAVGYGLDHGQRHRNLDYVAALAE